MEGTLLDGVTVSARALGWDARDNDGTEWALFHSDLPALSRVVGTLTVNWVDDPGYTQFVVNGIPVDPASIVREDHTEFSVLVAAGTHEGAIKAWQIRDHGVPGQMSKADFKKYLATAQPGQAPHAPLGPGQKAALTKKFKAIDAQVAADKAEWEATMAAMAAHNAEVEAAAAAVEAASAQAAVEQYEYQQKVAAEEDAKAIEMLGGQPAVDAILDKQLAALLPPDPLAQVETTASGKVQLTKEAFAKYLETATADSVPPGPLGAGQKAAITKKLKTEAMLADIAELDAIDAAADKKAISDAAYATAKEAQATADTFHGADDPIAFNPAGDDVFYGPGEDAPGSTATQEAEAAAAVEWLQQAPELSGEQLDQITDLANIKAQAKSGPLSTMEFQAWLQDIDPSSIIEPPSQMLPWQKAALTKKLKSVSTVPEFLPGPVSTPPGPAQAKPAGPKLQTPSLDANDTLAAIVAKPSQAPPSQKTLDKVTSITSLNNYILAATGHAAAPGSPDAVLKQAKKVAAQHAFDNQLLGQIGYAPTVQMTARDARRAVLRETGQRKPTGGAGQGPDVHTFYGATPIAGMSREKLEAIITHHSGGVTTKASLKNVGVPGLVKLAQEADTKYNSLVQTLTQQGIAPGKIPHSAYGAQQLYIGKSKGLVGDYLAAPSVAATKVTKAAQAKLDAAAKKAAKKAASDAKKTPAQLATKPAGWGSMTPGEKWSWSHAYNLQAKGIYPKTATTPGGAHALGQHIVKPFPTVQKAVTANLHAVDALPAGNHFSSSNHNTRNNAFEKSTTSTQRAAWTSYTASGYTEMNGCLKRGSGCTEQVKARNNALIDAIRLHGSPAPKVLFRGKHRGTAKDLARKVGSEYEDPGFGSWSGTINTPSSFASTGSTTVKHSIMYRLVDSKGIRAAPSMSGENESILPPKTRFRVLAITDFTAGDTTHRILDVEVIYKPYG